MSRATVFIHTALGQQKTTSNFMVIFKETVLNQPIEQLDFSNAFKTAMETLDFHTLSDLLKHPTRELQDLPGFGILLLHEYVSFVERQGLGHYIDPV